MCAVLTGENVDRLREAFRDLHSIHRNGAAAVVIPRKSGAWHRAQNLCLQTDLGALGLPGSVMGVGDFDRVLAGSIEIELFGRAVRVMRLEDRIAAKQALGREKDLLAVKELRAMLEKTRC